MKKKQETPSNGGAKNDKHQAAQATADDEHNQTEAAAEAPADSELQRQLDEARKESATNLEGWQRTLAEFQNYRRRTERETRDTYQNATADVLKSLLPVVDDFERAMSSAPEAIKQDAWFNGVTLIHRKFLKVLEDYNVTPIDPQGEPFDPNRHQALGSEESADVESGRITEVLQKGYAVGDRVLRPALVKVAQ